MTEADDIELLRQYAGENSETAFATLAGRHVNLVYSTALRHTGNPHAAEEITQAVFIILARKAKSLSRQTILTGWLHQTTRLTAANYLRTEIRRQHRESEAFMQSALSETETWTQIAPLLDDAISKLNERERNAILLRYFENKSAREMAAALRVDEPAAQKRVTRAVEKLRKFFAKRGVTLTAAAIAGAISANSVQAAPAGLAATVTATAAKGAAVAASISAIAKAIMKTMIWMKLKVAIGVSVGVVLAAGMVVLAIDSTPPPPTSSSHLEFYTFLKNTPIISKAVFERELSQRQTPNESLRQTFEFSLDGSNYLSTIRDEDGAHPGNEFGAGQYGQLAWIRQLGYLQLFDLQLNKIEGNNGNIPAIANLQFGSLSQLLLLGVTATEPGSTLTWSDSGKQFFAKGMNGQNVMVEFRGDEPPASALVASVWNRAANDRITNYWTIFYKYSPGYNEGRFPYEFALYRGLKADKANKVWVIRVQSIDVATNHLTAEILDPRKIYQIPPP